MTCYNPTIRIQAPVHLLCEIRYYKECLFPYLIHLLKQDFFALEFLEVPTLPLCQILLDPSVVNNFQEEILRAVQSQLLARLDTQDSETLRSKDKEKISRLQTIITDQRQKIFLLEKNNQKLVQKIHLLKKRNTQSPNTQTINCLQQKIQAQDQTLQLYKNRRKTELQEYLKGKTKYQKQISADEDLKKLLYQKIFALEESLAKAASPKKTSLFRYTPTVDYLQAHLFLNCDLQFISLILKSEPESKGSKYIRYFHLDDHLYYWKQMDQDFKKVAKTLRLLPDILENQNTECKFLKLPNFFLRVKQNYDLVLDSAPHTERHFLLASELAKKKIDSFTQLIHYIWNPLNTACHENCACRCDEVFCLTRSLIRWDEQHETEISDFYKQMRQQDPPS